MKTVNNIERDLSKENFIKISNDWIYSKKEDNNLIHKYSRKALSLYCLIKQCITYSGRYKITHYDLEDWFGVTRKRDKSKLFEMIENLAKDKLILLQQDYNLKDVPKSNIYFTFPYIKNNFFKVYNYEIDTIIHYSENEIDKHSLLLVFLAIKRHYNSDSGICYPSISNISNYTKLSQEVILKAIDILVEVSLIIYDNPGARVFEDGTIKECNNIYTMNYENNKEILRKYINQQNYKVDKKYNKQRNKKVANQKRSIKMKINNLDEKYKNNKIKEELYNKEKSILEDKYNNLNNHFEITDKDDELFY